MSAGGEGLVQGGTHLDPRQRVDFSNGSCSSFVLAHPVRI